MGTAVLNSRPARSENINLRVTRSQKELIDQAAEASGRSRSEFMLDAACRAAEAALLDRTFFTLPAEKFDRLVEMLDHPPAPNPTLIRLMQTKAPWEQ